ncbi:MAG: response regulator, partial [Planctomycetota bacterium]|nr:response regulator [Planctomycetota bacterium]
MRIGIVNDMSLAREALRRAVLNGTGHEVAWVADDGASAVEMSLRDQPDVILMDLIMPGMNGVEATRRIMS